MNDPPSHLIRDPAALRHRLAGQTFDLRTLDLAGFRRWLERQLAGWRSDPVFVQRARIRDLRRAHPELREFDRAYREAARVAAATPQAARLAAIGKKRHNVERAIGGLDQAIARAAPDERPRLAAKRQDFAALRRDLDEEEEQLVRSSPEQRALTAAIADLRRVWEAIGLNQEMVRLNELQTARGRASGRAGSDFEQAAVAIARRHLVPDQEGEHLHVLRAVRLGAAGVELDITVVRRSGGVDEPVEVLAVVEVKRNINDLAHGFLRRQVDLGWLTGVGDYDPAVQRTGRFPTGHFDRPAVHWQDGQAYRFDQTSFRRFVRDPASGYFLDGLFLATRAGPVWGVSGAVRARIGFRAATDEEWDPTSEIYLQRLFDWCRTLAGPVETPDVLELYLGRSSRLLVIE